MPGVSSLRDSGATLAFASIPAGGACKSLSQAHLRHITVTRKRQVAPESRKLRNAQAYFQLAGYRLAHCPVISGDNAAVACMP